MTSKPWLLLLFLLSVGSDLLPAPDDEASYGQCPDAVNITNLNQAIIVDIMDDDSQEGAVFSSCSEDYYSIESKKNAWYTLLGTGKVLTASTCHPDTDIDAQITVYKDECITTACADLIWGSGPGCPGVCIAATATTTTVSSCAHLGASISWDSDVNRTYYLQVSQQRDTLRPVVQAGRDAAEPCSGSAVLTVTESARPVNLNACVNALPLWPKDAEPPVPQLNGTTTTIRESCPGLVGPAFGDGLWYTLVVSSNETDAGSGTIQQKVVQMPLCNNITGAQITMQIYKGTDCLDLVCLNQYAIRPDESCSSNLVFVAAAGQIYYLYVVAKPGVWDPDFALADVNLSPLDAPASNQECSTAETLLPDGSTTTVLYDSAYDPTRDYDPSSQPTLWYTLESTVNPLRLQICGPGQLEVSVGSCSESNVTITQYLPGDCIILPTIEPMDMAVLLRLESIAGGTSFPVNITTWELDSSLLVENSNCGKAFGPIEYSNNDNSAPFMDALVNPILDGDIQDLARFYYAEVPSDGMFLQGTVCRLSPSGDFELSLEETFSFEFCSNAVALGSGTLMTEMDANGCRSISWNSIDNSPLIIGVHGREEFEFSIQLQQMNASGLPVNDQQPAQYRPDNTGLVTLTLDSPVQGSTANALSDPIDPFQGFYCPNIVPNKPGVWFATSLGSGKDLVVCLKSSVNTSTAQLAVFGSLLDIDAIYEGCLPDAEEYVMDTACITALRWPALDEAFYSILVQTDTAESFELSMYSITDVIAEPGCLVPGNDSSSNSTENSLPTSTPAPISPPSTILSPTTALTPSGSAIPPTGGNDDLVEATPVSNMSPVRDPSAPAVSNADEVSETSHGSALYCFSSWKTRVISFSTLMLATVQLL